MRRLAPGARTVVFVGLNPSAATAEEDGPTIPREVNFPDEMDSTVISRATFTRIARRLQPRSTMWTIRLVPTIVNLWTGWLSVQKSSWYESAIPSSARDCRLDWLARQGAVPRVHEGWLAETPIECIAGYAVSADAPMNQQACASRRSIDQSVLYEQSVPLGTQPIENGNKNPGWLGSRGRRRALNSAIVIRAFGAFSGS